MNAAGEAHSLRSAARELISRAAGAGIEEAYLLTTLSPREIELYLQAIEEKRREDVERMDMQAWLTGRYVLMAMHAPRRYPHRPEGVRQKNKAMADESMKRVFLAMAARREDEHGGS